MEEVALFGSRLSPFVEKVWRALHYKGLEFEFRTLRSPRDFAKHSPETGKMPVAWIAGERLWDSTFILQRLDALVPDPPLYWGDPETRARQRLLEDWCDEALVWNVAALAWSPKNAPAKKAQLTAGMSPLWGWLGRVFTSSAQVRAQGMGRLPVDILVRELAGRLDDLIALLGDRPFLCGDRPSAADFALVGQLRTMTLGPVPEAEALLAERALLRSYRERVETLSGGA